MRNYYLIFVLDDQWSFYGFYWHKEDMGKKLEYVKERFKDYKLVEGSVDLTLIKSSEGKE